MRIASHTRVLLLLLAGGAALRFVGIDRGRSDFVLPEAAAAGYTEAFYAFHPDELTILQSALQPIDLLDPPFTVYGTLPVYGLRAALLAAESLGGWGKLDLEAPPSRRRIYHVARVLAAAASCAVLILVFVVACRLAGPWAAVAAVFLTAFAPGAIQQAHFYIVDGLFAAASLATLWAILAGRRHRRRRDALVVGLLIGVTMSIRFNGGLLGLVWLAALWAAPETGPGRMRLAALARSRALWTAAVAAFAVAAVFQLYVFVRPGLLVEEGGIGDFAITMKFAAVTYLQPWTLVDADVTPYVDHWFGMWPLIVGWPLTLAFLVALGWGAVRGGPQGRLLMLWCLLYFLPVGALKARAVRHLVPLLAPLAVLAVAAAADGLAHLRGHWRTAALGLAALAGVHLFLFGTAFATIYRTEDSRIQAGRFIARRVVPKTLVGVEGGAFSMAGLVSGERYRHLWLDTSVLLYAGPYMTCADRIEYLGDSLDRAGVLTFTDVNRYAQYRAVPQLFPVVASFYERLLKGALGFHVVRRYKVYPEVGGLVFRDDGVDPSYLGYDHPAAYVLRKPAAADMETALRRWNEAVAGAPPCPDRPLQAAAERLRDGDPQGALGVLDAFLETTPHALLAYRVRAEAHRLAGDSLAAARDMRRYLPATAGGRMAHVFNPGMVHFATPSAAASLVRVGLYDLALAELRRGLDEGLKMTRRAARSRARAYLRAALAFERARRWAYREQALRMSLRVDPTTEACNALARLLGGRGRNAAAGALLERSLKLDATQGQVHLALGELATRDPGLDREQALFHLRRAVELDSALADRARQLRRQLGAAP